MSQTDLRVLIGPTNTADQGPALALALRALGVRAVSLVRWPHPFYPPADWQGRSRGPIETLVAYDRFFALARSADVVHLQSEGLLPPLPISVPPAAERQYLRLAAALIRRLRRAGVVVAVTFHGTDIRPASEILDHWESGGEVLQEASLTAAARRRLVRYSEALASEADLVFVTTPDLLPLVAGSHLTPVMPSRPFNAALEAAAGGDEPTVRREGPLRILHAPSDAVIKGSTQVEAAVRLARAGGAAVDYRLIQGMPVAAVLQELRDADLVIDQLRLGWYGVFAAEAMALGRPAVARLTPRNLDAFARATGFRLDQLGVLDADAATLAPLIQDLAVADGARWQQLRARARYTYARLHRPEAVAEQILRLYGTAAGVGAAELGAHPGS